MLWNDGHMLEKCDRLTDGDVANENVTAGWMSGIHARCVAGARAAGMTEGGTFRGQVKITCKICD
jgi:hypothetical protein